MADAFVLNSNLAAVLKDGWAIEKDATATEAFFVGYSKIGENQDGGVEWDGKQNRINVPFQTKINRQSGPLSSGEARKASGYSTDQLAYFTPPKKYDGVFGISEETILMARSASDSAVNKLQRELKNVKLSILKELHQDYHMAGDGAKCYLPAADNAASVTVVAPAMVEVGDVVNITDGTSARLTNDDTVTAVGDASWSDGLPTQEVTLTDSPASTAAKDYFVRSTQDDPTAANLTKTYNRKTVWGLGAIVDTGNPSAGNFGNLDRTNATYKLWQAHVAKGNSSSAYPYINSAYFRELKLSDMDSVYESQALAGGKLSYLLGSHAMVREYISMEQMNTNRTPAMVKNVDWAVEGPEYRGKPVVADPYCLPCRFYFIDASGVGKKTIRPLSPWPNEDEMMQPDLSKTYAFTCSFLAILEVISGTPWAEAALVDVYEGFHAGA